MNKKKPGAYEIGYCKPPVATQFIPGQSGNPGGTKRKAAPGSITEALHHALMKKENVVVNGRCKRLTRATIISEQLTMRATKGDAEAIRDILRHERERLRYATAQPPEPEQRRKVVVALNLGDEDVPRRIEERMIEDGVKAVRAKLENPPPDDE
jgi:hypothetical protein